MKSDKQHDEAAKFLIEEEVKAEDLMDPTPIELSINDFYSYKDSSDWFLTHSGTEKLMWRPTMIKCEIRW
jgi:hypothetical protein